MSTLDRSVRDYLSEVAAPAPSSTGGSVCAVTAAAAAGLAGMTAGLSKTLEGSRELAEQADQLRERALTLVTADSVAYRAVCTVQRLDRHSPGRSQAIRDALVAAAQPPLRIAHLAAEVASMAALLAAQGNPVTRGDAITAANLASAAARSAAVLVRINLDSAEVSTNATAEADAAAESADRSAQLAQSSTVVG